MASFRAIETISNVLVQLLEASHERLEENEEGNGLHETLQFEVYRSEDFRSQDTGSADISLFLYRVLVNGTNRTPPGRRTSSGELQQTQLPIDLHYLITVWTQDTKKQHRIAGWVMRVLETTPVLPSGVLHGMEPTVFEPDETLEIIANDLTNEELFRIWDILDEPYRLSIPYLVRNVRIESGETVPAEAPVERRIFDLLQHGGKNGSRRDSGRK